MSTFLANLLPWWRFSVPLVSVVASVAVFATAISMLALLGPWRRNLFGPVAVVCLVTLAVLAADVMTGSRLQLSSLLGLQPVIGGRFYGVGNPAFAVFATATLMLCTAVGNHLAPVQPRIAAATVAAIGLVAVIVDASPSWGSDLGGPPALLPGVILLVLTILQIRLTWRRWLAIGGGIGAFLILLSLLDWLRPADSRSHLGRFVQTALDGGAGDIIARKLDQNVTLLLLGNPLSRLMPVGLVLLAYMLARPASRAARPLRRSFGRVGLLRTGLIAVLVMWVIGFALNDSGTAIPSVAILLAGPLVVAIAVKTLEDEMLAGPATTRASLRLR